jgi:hypothetical protein
VFAAVLLALGLGACSGGSGSAPVARHETENEPVTRTLSGSCGVERWDVKTGADLTATNVGRLVKPSTIAALDKLKAPVNPTARVPGVETSEYQITATLVEYKVEADSDVHLVLSDGSNTMIAEIPSPACVGPSSPFLPSITATRQAFDARYPPTGTLTKVGKPITVTGVGFFDRIHGQAGVAPNGIELHPVLAVVLP